MSNTFFSQKDLQSGAELLAKGKVETVLFSEGTYQVEVYDLKGKEASWPFLQITDEGKIKDHFCTCHTEESQGSCAHQAAAFLKIFNGKIAPLHVRFRSSLWNALCQMAARRHGYEVSVLQGNLSKEVQAQSATGKCLFFMRATSTGKNREKAQKKIKEIALERPKETEDTSLKFSNLSPQELALWREGRPSYQLQYELSFWSDLAKWWMLLQEAGEKYTITFQSPLPGLPKGITVKFPNVEFGFYIAEANWPYLIPFLSNVHSPLRVFEFTHQQIKRLAYDSLRKAFLLDIETPEEFPEIVKHSYPVGEWLFVEKQGFYPSKLDPLLKEKLIPKEKIPAFLQRHSQLLEKHLVGTKITLEPTKAHYHLSCDSSHSLQIRCYVFEPGDLQRVNSVYFGPWVYVAEKGFFRLENLLFEGIEKNIPKEEVSEFVSHHRHWLNAHQGFETHVTSIESKLTYELTLPEMTLHFYTKLDLAEENEEAIDFGDWIYVKGRGFYSKISQKQGQILKADLKVERKDMSAFIKGHHEELENVTSFFSDHTPLEKAGLKLSLNENEQIVIEPEFLMTPAYRDKKVDIFENFTYVKGEGFFEIPPEHRLPEPYFKKTMVEVIAEPYFVSHEIDTLKPFILTIDPQLQKPTELFLRILQMHKDPVESGMWLIDLVYESEIGTVDALVVWEALSKNQRYIFSNAGLLLLKQARFNWLKGIPKKRWAKKGKQIRLTTLEWIRLFVFEDIREPEDDASNRLFEDFKQCHSPDFLNLEGLKSQLRPYQETGLKWLWFLYHHGLSGLLCDEMGLGKTHQAMALLAAVHNFSPKEKFLVVCPTSVIFHWQELLRRFLPKLRVCVFYGIQRSLTDFAEHYDLILTSYGTLRSEKNPLSQISFAVAIFDEIQIAKNAQSQTHKALKLIEAHSCIGLTGTPIENRLVELKALFDVVLPTYMPPESVFKELFVTPIEKQQDAEKRQLLMRFIHPFVLRRKKSEVLQELPDKIEEIAYAPLSEEQKELYRNVYLVNKDAILQELHDPTKPVPYLHVFAMLTKLKQICDHPCLSLGNPKEYKKHASGKWDLFVELLQETRESGQKLVVFSQYLDMLDIIESHLKEQKIGYAGIRGSTRDRKAQVERFRDDPLCEVFVGSLQAAGVGIDLIAASVVIHYDRWWNPAKENQATDRVHRIGQSRGVQVFKMVTKGTIEEHIHQLIEKKNSLMEEIVGYDDQTHIKSLTRNELAELIQLMDVDQLS